MDLEKLEKLSCLKIDKQHTQSMEKSLQGVIEMMQSVTMLSAKDFDEKSVELFAQKSTNFRMEDALGELASKEQPAQSLHVQEGYFLAPKVVKK